MYKVSETVLPIYTNGQCPIIKTCSDVTLNLSSKDSMLLYRHGCHLPLQLSIPLQMKRELMLSKQKKKSFCCTFACDLTKVCPMKY